MNSVESNGKSSEDNLRTIGKSDAGDDEQKTMQRYQVYSVIKPSCYCSTCTREMEEGEDKIVNVILFLFLGVF